ncbi:hypothetical protein LINPERHAP1_LOCUS30303 [Linum perenne]
MRIRRELRSSQISPLLYYVSVFAGGPCALVLLFAQLCFQFQLLLLHPLFVLREEVELGFWAC